MSDNGLSFDDTFNRSGDSLGAEYRIENAKWMNPKPPKLGDTASATCKQCGNVVTLKAGETISYDEGDTP